MAILAGIALRVGLPLALTALAAWALRRLDRRWQREAELSGRSQGRGAATGRVRCWEARGCAESAQTSCPAHSRPETPCWQVFREIEGGLPERCLECEVFLDAPLAIDVSS